MDNPVIRGLVAFAKDVYNFVLRAGAVAGSAYLSHLAGPPAQSLPGFFLSLVGIGFFFVAIFPPLYKFTKSFDDPELDEIGRKIAHVADPIAVALAFIGGVYLAFNHAWYDGWQLATTLLVAVILALAFLEKAFAIGHHRPSRIFWLWN